ncbi:LacI family DNA-binding transcriptional regulator [Phenylobacterium deserti]|uniref:LacI family transcriptional regulator n=1 Tax=Phenylobacterium deserti TaxID=1914756 RepID=A0A328ADR2_9CAUL|nr:LacI family DNA-binding transcriptional regulator [Phenylobacterium deserti]RAK52780.1 LacI family transcriptional regulator [Phenylobacterium deserti]
MAKAIGRGRGPTIIDVARVAGVSKMTVSRVINNEAGVRDGTRKAVLAAIRTLNYEPNIAARTLVTAGEARVGVVYSNPSAAFMSDFLIGVFEEAAAKGVRLTLVKGEDGLAPPEAELRRMAQGVDGVVLAPPLGELPAIRQVLSDAHLPTAVVAVGQPTGEGISVRIDDWQASHDMARHLLSLGHRRIGFIAGNPDQSSSALRLEGCRAAVDATPGAELIIAQGAFSYTSGLRAAEWLLDEACPPTAIFASNDDMAAAAVSVAHRRHLDVPRDLTVVGFDDTTVATTLWPPLTTIRQPVRQMAATALELLMGAIRNGAPAAGDHLLSHALVERQSTAPPNRARAPAPALS